METLRNKTCLVIGGLGFIGSHLCERLVKLKAKVIVADSLLCGCGGDEKNVAHIEDQIEIYNKDVRHILSISWSDLIKRSDYIFYLASLRGHEFSMNFPFFDLEINVHGPLNILEQCKEVNKNVKIIYLSTRQVYGNPQHYLVDEKHPLNPPDINAVHRLTAENYFQLYYKVHGIECCILRLTNVMGPRMNLNEGFLGKWINKLIKGNTIEVWGKGDLIRDIIYVDDVVTAICLAASRSESVGKTYNLGGAVEALTDIALSLVKVWGKGDIIYKKLSKGVEKIGVGDYIADWTLINRELGWYPTIDFEQMIKRTLEYYR